MLANNTIIVIGVRFIIQYLCGILCSQTFTQVLNIYQYINYNFNSTKIYMEIIVEKRLSLGPTKLFKLLVVCKF